MTRSNVRVHRHVHDHGWIDDTNWLLRHGEGDYLFFAFHDDPQHQTYVERLVDALGSTPDAVLAFSDITVEFETSKGAWNGVATFEALAGLVDPRARCRVMRAMEGYSWIPNRGVFRRGAAARVGGLRRHLAGEFCADWPWLVHLALIGPFVRVPETPLHKRLRLKGLSQSCPHNAQSRLAVVVAAVREILIADLPWSWRIRLACTFSVYWMACFARKLVVNPLGRI